MRRLALIGTALVLVAVGGAQAQSPTPISISAGKYSIGGLVATNYGTPVQITGRVGNGQAGVAVVLQASTFPFAGFSAVGHAMTAAAGGYTFSARPALATRYRVALTSDPASTSHTVTVYVLPSIVVVNPPCANGQQCVLHVGVDAIYPPAVAVREGAKPAYFYLGVRNGSSTLHPSRLNLIQTGSQHRVSGNRFSVRFTTSFPTPRAYHDNWWVCTKATEAADGLGLPGHGHCGDRSIPYPIPPGYIR
jgi:hypothetical protein